ncbi:carboxypeptidase-like regulatory domain-containing protein [Halobacteria archaeon AArc-m2/3/4]|uniref:Carboxypeptidase-like regulatory domain-containing protein n=1 Tax=Natronoglomus mannanivorans TaxID=2979990 RepID=A0ABT2QL15_9EURY|nr:carboxypeptidase-like regulatory domain-containing protein [Halobacteria archaeon AArc-m2/3/4]
MNERQSQLGRRRVLELAGAATVAGLAGCMDDENGNGDDGAENGDENGDEENENGNGDDVDEAAFGNDDEETILFSLENEDGDPVSEGVTVTVVPEENESMSYIVDSEDEMEGGEFEQPLMEPGDYHITVEGEDFEDIEETVTVEEGETEEVTLTLEGAPAEGEGEDKENGETDDSEDNGDEEENDDTDE